MSTRRCAKALGKGALWLVMASAMGTAAADDARSGPPRPPGTDGLIFYACAKGGKVIPGTIQVGDAPRCNGGASMVWWAQRAPLVRTFGGVVAADGSVRSGAGFTVDRVAVGKYQITFARGVVARGSAMTVTPYFARNASNNYYVATAVTDTQLLSDGSRVFEVSTSTTMPTETAFDSGFMFVVAPPAPAGQHAR